MEKVVVGEVGEDAAETGGVEVGRVGYGMGMNREQLGVSSRQLRLAKCPRNTNFIFQERKISPIRSRTLFRVLLKY
jgi:hypothetical protein